MLDIVYLYDSRAPRRAPRRGRLPWGRPAIAVDGSLFAGRLFSQEKPMAEAILSRSSAWADAPDKTTLPPADPAATALTFH